MNASPRHLGAVALVSLVALRILIGFHFYREGAEKIQNPRPYSAAFLSNATGPYASVFHNMVWDADGLARLDKGETVRMWEVFREGVIKYYKLEKDSPYEKEVQAAYKRHKAQLDTHFAAYAPEIREYQLGLTRRDEYRAKPARQGVASLREQLDSIESDLRSQRAEVIAPIDQMWNSYEAELNSIANPEGQWKSLALARPGRRALDSTSIDGIIRYFDITIGALLVLGLFTRVAATLGALFLASVVASQWPTAPDAIATWPQMIEALGLAVIAATATGRVAGVDFFLNSFCARFCAKQETSS